MLYILLEKYLPGTAPTNRILSYAKGLSENGIQATVLFLFPNINGDKVETSYPYVYFKYLWISYFSFNRYLKWIVAKINIYRFIKSLKKGDIIYLYNNSELIDFFVGLNGIKVYHERTEYPEAHEKIYTRFNKITMEQYYDSCKRLHGLFVISTELKKLFVDKGVPESNIHIINITVDSDRFEGLQKNNGCKYIAYCGTVSNNKDGVDSLIRAFSIFSKEYNDYKLLIIGTVPSKFEQSSNSILIDKLGIKDKVEFTGFVTPEEMPQILKNSCILALDRPDNIQAMYGFPTKLGEYLLSQNPVIVTKVGDIPLFLKHKETAFLVKPDNDEEFAKGLMWLVDNPYEASLIGLHGAEVAIQQFNYKMVIGKILNVINLN